MQHFIGSLQEKCCWCYVHEMYLCVCLCAFIWLRQYSVASFSLASSCGEYLPNGNAAKNWWTTLSLAQWGNRTPTSSVSSRAFGDFCLALGLVKPCWTRIWNAMNIYEPFKPDRVQDQQEKHNCPTSRLCHWFILLEFAPHSGIQGAIVEVIWKKQKGTEKPRRT